MYCRVPLEGYQTICIRFFSFVKGQQVFKSINQSAVYTAVRITQKEHLLTWKSDLYNYQRETAIFLAAKHEKIIMALSYLIF